MSSSIKTSDKSHDGCEETNQHNRENPISPWKQHMVRKCSIPEQLETLRQNGLHKFGSAASSYCRPLFPRPKSKMNDDIVEDYHPWSCKRHCSLPHIASNIAWSPTRIRNMMLAVGPGTPASVLWIKRDRASIDDFEIGRHYSPDMSDFDDSDDNDGEEYDENEEEDEHASNEAAFERVMMDMFRNVEPPTPRQPPRSEARHPTFGSFHSSIRHEGCINTASWLHVPWRLVSPIDRATSGQNFVTHSSTSSAYEIPTQLITSGDDCMIKVWDLKNSMGTISPLDGGWDTLLPLTLSDQISAGYDETYNAWCKFHDKRNDDSKIAGSVQLLATMHSGHRANVFDVQPLMHKPGIFLSCGADGFLRLSDLESSSSVEVFNPGMDVIEGFTIPMMSLERFNDRMAYSFQLLTQDTGLLCSDRGLYHFDIRLRPNQQNHVSMYQPRSISGSFQVPCCKACVVWKPRQYREFGSYPVFSENEAESPYVFAGGSGEYVELLDLRMISGSSSNNVLERYCPDVFKDGKPSVCVSGINITRDGRELLVSYENDQIYTFKILGGTSSSAGPSPKDIEESSKLFGSDVSRSIDYHAMYGGHINCVTFLKQTAYAGPNDEYILTGGDAGKAWIYDRSTGAVVAMLNTDRNACNGIIPHPTLPYFISYGIGRTAKLWRARSSSDSPHNRAEESVQRQEYQPGPLIRQWNDIIQEMQNRDDNISLVFPDVILTLEKSEEDMNICGQVIEDIENGFAIFSTFGNSLRCLEFELSDLKSRYYNSKMSDSSSNFLAQGLHVHTIGITWRRLHAQATRLGMRVNNFAPWVFEKFINTANPIHGFHPADLVPAFPSDFISYHPLMQNVPFPEAYSSLIGLQKAYPGRDDLAFNNTEKKMSLSLPWLSDELQQTYMNTDTSGWDSDLSLSGSNVVPADSFTPIISLTLLHRRSGRILEDTIDALKNGGNEAMKLGLYYKAAQRYDTAIGYCAVALMRHVKTDKILSPFTEAYLTFGDSDDVPPGTKCKLWSPIARNFLAIRLNLSLLMLKPEFNTPVHAAELAEMVLGQLEPFTKELGIVKYAKKLCKKEPMETYIEAKTVQSKAHFRLGCALYELKEYARAASNFQKSLDCFNEVQHLSTSAFPETRPRKPDAALLRRLHDAKLQMKKKKDRTNQKFLSALGSS